MGGRPPQVLVTIKPVHSLVAAVMEGVGQPALLIGRRTRSIQLCAQAFRRPQDRRGQVIFWIGSDLETYLKTPLANLAPEATHRWRSKRAPGVYLPRRAPRRAVEGAAATRN